MIKYMEYFRQKKIRLNYAKLEKMFGMQIATQMQCRGTKKVVFI